MAFHVFHRARVPTLVEELQLMHTGRRSRGAAPCRTALEECARVRFFHENQRLFSPRMQEQGNGPGIIAELTASLLAARHERMQVGNDQVRRFAGSEDQGQIKGADPGVGTLEGGRRGGGQTEPSPSQLEAQKARESGEVGSGLRVKWPKICQFSHELVGVVGRWGGRGHLSAPLWRLCRALSQHPPRVKEQRGSPVASPGPLCV